MPHLDLADLHTIADLAAFDFGRIIDLADDDGFIGTGADLSTATLLNAYRSGAFPWFGADDPICWWCPPVRCVLSPNAFRPAKSLVRTAKKMPWHITTNHAFERVITACAKPRTYTDETWLGDEMMDAYTKLHHMGVAMSVEVWNGTPADGKLIGGLYGIQFGAVFCGESMFHTHTDASKIAFWGLIHFAKACHIQLIDCQLENPHLMSLGATLLPRDEFLTTLRTLSRTKTSPLFGDISTHALATQAKTQA